MHGHSSYRISFLNSSGGFSDSLGDPSKDSCTSRWEVVAQGTRLPPAIGLDRGHVCVYTWYASKRDCPSLPQIRWHIAAKPALGYNAVRCALAWAGLH